MSYQFQLFDEITNQQMFDNAALGIIGQGGRPADLDGVDVCVVLTADGRRCALGWSCTDAFPGAETTRQWQQLDATQIGEALRCLHDEILLYEGFSNWRIGMAKLALKFGLDDSALYFIPVRQTN